MGGRTAPRTLGSTRCAAGAVLLSLLLLPAGAAQAFLFTDAQDAAGLSFVHASSDPQNYPETNGSGLCWGDVDGDGTDDLFLVNGLYANQTQQAAFDPRSALYLNDGDGTFTDATRAWRADLTGWGQGCSLADYDGDGDQDLLVVGYGMLVLLRNDGRRFTDVTQPSGLSLVDKCGEGITCFGETGSWGDYDRDGDLDVYITNYVSYDIELGGPVTPSAYPGQKNLLWRNNGDGTFTDVTDAAGVGDDPGPTRSKSFQSVWADYDRDGWPDLYVASDTVPNSLFRNQGDGTFTDVAGSLLVDDPRASMGLLFQDLDGDGLPDLYMTHYAFEHNGYYRNLGGGQFQDRSALDGLGPQSEHLAVGWGAGAHDFDHDGDADIVVVNGHTSSIFPDHKQKPLLFRRNANATWTEVRAEAGPSFNTSSVARGSAVADYDLDGDLDIAVLAQFNETARLFRNDEAPGRWLQVEARQPGGMNRFAIGAEVTVTPEGGSPWTRIVQAGSSFLSQDSLVVHAGLGGATRATVQVRWPDGTLESWGPIDHGQRVRLLRGDPAVVRDTLSPVTTILTAGEGGPAWYRGPVTVSLSAVDRAMGVASGVAGSESRVDGAAWDPYAGPFLLAAEGIHRVDARSTDQVGNREPVRSLEVRVDATPPVTGAVLQGLQGEDGWFLREASVRLVSSDAVSGVARVWHRLDGGAWVESDRLMVIGTGRHVVEFYAEDVAGNAEAVRSIELDVDADPPAVRLEPWPVGLGYGSLAWTAHATDVGSGVARVAFYVGEEATPRHVDEDGGDGWTWVQDEAGALRVRAMAEDRVGLLGSDAAVGLTVPAPMPLPIGLLVLGALPWLRRRA